MENSKVKNLIILILALMNLFLLFIVTSDSIEQSRSIRLRNEALYEVLSSRSILLGDDVSLRDFVPAEIVLRRSLSTERKLVSSMVGAPEISDQGGEIYVYTGSGGTACFYGDGELDMALYTGSFSTGNNPVSAAVSALRKMGLSTTNEGALVRETNSATYVTLLCTYEGSSVFESGIECTFTGGKLTLISGKRVFDEPDSITTPQTYPDSATIIMSLLRHLDETGEICTEITSLEAGYLAETPQMGLCKLRPVWQITINGGNIYYFDGITGEIAYPTR